MFELVSRSMHTCICSQHKGKEILLANIVRRSLTLISIWLSNKPVQRLKASLGESRVLIRSCPWHSAGFLIMCEMTINVAFGRLYKASLSSASLTIFISKYQACFSFSCWLM